MQPGSCGSWRCVAIDIRKLEPVQLVRLLNSTPLGTVIDERQLYRHRNRAGYRIGDSNHIDLLKYLAWLTATWLERRARPDGKSGYAAIKAEAAKRRKDASREGRDIGQLPRVMNSKRKKRAAKDFRYFCEAYFPHIFPLKFSQDHRTVISHIETAATQGGQFALAMPKGTGKTSITECACLWAVLYGLREFVCLIGASKDAATEMIESIKMQLETNPRLLADFPKAIYPIRKLEGIANRCSGQLYEFKRTHIEWTGSMIVMPTIPGSKASGAIIKVTGITGRIAGMKYTRPDGMAVRPSLVVIDDPQTDESAYSDSQCVKRERTIMESILGLAGPKKRTTTIMLCTVWRTGDVADNLLNREKHPDWNGVRTKMVYQFPANEKLWTKYAEARVDSFRLFGDIRDATKFYKAHREKLDEGAVVAWPERFNPDELSAVQHAMNLKLRDERAFWAIYQNEPQPEALGEDEERLTANQIAAKINRRKRRSIPLEANHLTAFIDVQAKLLFWMVAAWADDFTGYVVDYGAYPGQRRPYFTLDDARPTLKSVAPKTKRRGAIYAGLEALTDHLLGREWLRDDYSRMRIGRCLIDANWETPVIYQFCKQTPWAALIYPSHGHGVGARNPPWDEYKKKAGERVGHGWRLTSSIGKRAARHVMIDTNTWKTFAHAHLAIPMGDRGCLSLFGSKPEHHRLLADHLTSEFRIKTEGRGRSLYEWQLRPTITENHWLDCLVGCCVAASMQGAETEGVVREKRRRRRRISIAEMRKRTHGK